MDLRKMVLDIAETEAEKVFTPEQIKAAKNAHIESLEAKLQTAVELMQNCRTDMLKFKETREVFFVDEWINYFSPESLEKIKK